MTRFFPFLLLLILSAFGWQAWNRHVASPLLPPPQPPAQLMRPLRPSPPSPVAETPAPAAQPQAELPSLEATVPSPPERPEVAEMEELLGDGIQDPAELAVALDSLLERMDWGDPVQASSLSQILLDLSQRSPGSRDVIIPYLERDAFKHLLVEPAGSKSTRTLLDTYLEIAGGEGPQRLLQLRRYERDRDSAVYLEDLYTQLTGHPPTAEEIEGTTF